MAESLTMARPYAKALHEIADKDGAKNWLPVMQVCKAFGDNKESIVFLNSHGLSGNQLVSTIGAIAQSISVTVPEKFADFAKILEKNKRFSLLPEIASLFIEEVNLSNDMIIAEIISAKPLSESSRDNLLHKLEQKYGKRVDATINIDQSLIGGALVKIGDTVIDGSIKGRLQQLSKALN